MTTDLEVVSSQPSMSEVEIVWKLAQRLADTEFVPQSFRGRPNAVLAAILTGKEVGVGPMQSLQSINVIQGKPTIAPELMRALVARAGHRIDVVEHLNDRCTVKGIRSDTGSEATVTWTLEDAKRANLAGKGAWITYPRAMLSARATSELCRLLFADVIAGVSYTPEEIGGENPPPGDADVIDVEEIDDSGDDRSPAHRAPESSSNQAGEPSDDAPSDGDEPHSEAML